MEQIIFLLALIAVLIAIVHFMTSSSETDRMGLPGKEFRAFLKKGKSTSRGISVIPLPPDGIRDEEVEDLMLAGRMREAHDLLGIRMEQAKMAPIGRDAKIARVSHYMSILNNLRR